MSKFALLLNHPLHRYSEVSDDDYMNIIKDYVSWVQEHVEKGIYVAGHKLNTDIGKTLTRSGTGIEVADAPSTEIAEILGGVMIIETNSLDEAVEVAKSHPHFVHNLSLQIFPIDEAVNEE